MTDDKYAQVDIKPEFIKDYNFLIKCNNIVVSILEMADKTGYRSEEIDVKPKDQKKFNSKKYDLEYFRKHGYSKMINKAHYKHMMFSVISDFSMSIYDAVMCASIYHINSAYTLVRKPLKDNLLIMELLVARSPAFMNRFFSRPIDEYAVDSISVDKKRKIIREANKLVLTGIPPISAKLLYTIRYDRKHYMTFQKIWDKTAHIITTNKHYKTENGNLNMIFNDEELIEQHVGYFYKTMPSVYYYALKLIIYFLYKEELITEEEYKANDNLISISYLDVLSKEEDINYEECSITWNCCNQEWDLSKEEHINEFVKLSNTFSCICPCCSSVIRSDRFIFDNKS